MLLFKKNLLCSCVLPCLSCLIAAKYMCDGNRSEGCGIYVREYLIGTSRSIRCVHDGEYFVEGDRRSIVAESRERLAVFP